MGFAFMEMKTIVAGLLARFSITLDPGVRDLAPVPLVSMRPNQPVWVNVRPRSIA